jgi:hypothetical protein
MDLILTDRVSDGHVEVTEKDGLEEKLPSSSLMGAPTSPFSVCTHDFPEKF